MEPRIVSKGKYSRKNLEVEVDVRLTRMRSVGIYRSDSTLTSWIRGRTGSDSRLNGCGLLHNNK